MSVVLRYPRGFRCGRDFRCCRCRQATTSSDLEDSRHRLVFSSGRARFAGRVAVMCGGGDSDSHGGDSDMIKLEKSMATKTWSEREGGRGGSWRRRYM